MKYKELQEKPKQFESLCGLSVDSFEHTIGKVKIFRIVKDAIRNWKQGFKDLVMEICCRLNNLEYHSNEVFNFFNNNSTNGYAESFNSKIKNFRANLRGVSDVKFFLFRLSKLFS